MAGVTNDSEAVDQFLMHLAEFNTALQEQFASMLAHWQEMGEVWRDQQYHQFGAALQDAASGVRRYLDLREQHEAYLAGLRDKLRVVEEHR